MATMQDRRVIYDSEEEDQGFSPLNSPVKVDASSRFMKADDDNDGQTLGDQIDDSRSTDPDLFKRIYEEQQRRITDLVPDMVDDTQAKNGFSDRLKSSDSKAKNNSSSITDPNLKSAKRRGLGKIGAKDFGNLTQVTTPSAPSAKQKDVYDFSLSDEEEDSPSGPAILEGGLPSTGDKKASKRKRGESADISHESATAKNSQQQLSSFNGLAQDQEDELPRPTRKRRKSEQNRRMRQVPDDVDLLVIPTSVNTREPSDETTMDAGGSDSIVPVMQVAQVDSHGHRDPPASFFIDPPNTLTLSQKNEYMRVSDHSELDGEDNRQQASLPLPRPAQTEGHRSTSTSVSTIAYTTPSRFASSLDPLPILGTSDGRSSNATTSSGRRTQMDRTHPLSSPDELNAPLTARKSRQKRRMSNVDEEQEIIQHESGDSDEIGNGREIYVPRPSRRRSGADQDRVTDTQAEFDTNMARKKRHKKAENVETAHENPRDSENIGYAPRSSRRRFGVMVDVEEELQHAEEFMPDTCPPGDANYKKTADVEPVALSLDPQEPDQATEAMDGVDPEVWAALPDEIRQELMSQQQTARTSQAFRTRRSGRSSEVASSLALVQEETSQPKKRGRKKKIQTIEEEPLEPDEPPAALQEPKARPSPAPAGTTKRKRGRPRKSEAAPPPASFEIEELGAAMEAPELSVLADAELIGTHALPGGASKEIQVPKSPAKRGRRKKVLEAETVHPNELKETAQPEEGCDDQDGNVGKLAVEPPHSPVDPPAGSVEVEDRQALRDISSTASNMLSRNGSALDQAAEKESTEEAEPQQGVTSEPKTKDVAKSASTPGQQGKVPLRVGLSKKSRIAPLLKIIRK